MFCIYLVFAVAISSLISSFYYFMLCFTPLCRHVRNWVQLFIWVPFSIRLQFTRLIKDCYVSVTYPLVWTGIFLARDFLGTTFGLDVRLPSHSLWIHRDLRGKLSPNVEVLCLWLWKIDLAKSYKKCYNESKENCECWHGVHMYISHYLNIFGEC